MDKAKMPQSSIRWSGQPGGGQRSGVDRDVARRRLTEDDRRAEFRQRRGSFDTGTALSGKEVETGMLRPGADDRSAVGDEGAQT
jgi:hypothetical protein